MSREAFSEREEHLRQRAARRWTEDEDVAVCIEEIDRLRAAMATEATSGEARGYIEEADRWARMQPSDPGTVATAQVFATLAVAAALTAGTNP